MKITKSVLIILLCFIIVAMTGCGNMKNLGSKSSELIIGVEGFEGNFNPFYAKSEADLEVVKQMFRPIQIKGTDNALINHSGSISYEFVGDKQVKYTVSINDNMKFSDGTHITIDDVLAFYHFISDATYDGTYKNWYLNDIVGIKEYYYDDADYAASVAEIEKTVEDKYSSANISYEDLVKYLVDSKLGGKYKGIDSEKSAGVTWKKYLTDSGYANEVENIKNNPSDEAWLKLVAKAEADSNSGAYNPASWYRSLLLKNYLKDNYADGTDVTEISGIKKVNDYTCSILFNSRNINAVSQINAPIIPQSCYSSDYVKGSADKVKEMTSFSIGSGPYIIAENPDNEVKMSCNDFYDEKCGFKTIRFIDLAAKSLDPAESVASGKVDVINTVINSEKMNKLKDAPVQYFINDCDYYISMFYNSRTLDESARKALISVCDPQNAVDGLVGSYYTRILSPISIRYPEYPRETEYATYSPESFSLYMKASHTPFDKFTAYYAGSESDLEYTFLITYKDILSKKGVELELICTDRATMNAAIRSGKADIWLDRVYDGPTCDKYDYFHSKGSRNLTGLNVPGIDALSVQIRTAVGLTDKIRLTENLMNLVMEQLVELPLYQLQNMTVYNTETVSPESFSENNPADGFTYYIPYLKPVD